MKVRYYAYTDGSVLAYCSDSTRASASGVFQRPR